MEKKLLLFFVLLFTIGFLFSTGIQPEGSGYGGDPYQITSLDNLEWVGSNPSSWNSYFIQMNDIDASACSSWGNGGWTPIGNGSIKFSGSYDGQGYSITGIYAHRNSNYQGFFGWVKEGEVYNLRLIDVDIEGANRVGGLSGAGSYNFEDAIVMNCSVTGSVSGNDSVGGLIGWDFRCQVTNCSANCEVDGSEDVGGLIGLITNNTYIRRSYSKGNVSGTINVGGLIGSQYQAYTSDSYSMADISCSEEYGGGLIGHLLYNNSVNNCYSLGRIQGNGENKGGLIGGNSYGYASINSSFWDSITSQYAVSFGGTSKTDSEMKDIDTFTNLNTTGLDNPWDFVGDPNDDVQDQDYWNMDSNKNNGYPFLSWQTFNSPPFVANPIADFDFDEDTTNSSINLNNVFDDPDLTDGDNLTFTHSGNNNINVSISNGIVTLNPNSDWNGAEEIVFSAIDTGGQTAFDSVLVTINPINDPPSILLPPSFVFDEDNSMTQNFSSYLFDIDSENLTLSVSGNTNIQVAIDGENVTFSAPQNWSGSETLTFTVDDLYNDDSRRLNGLRRSNDLRRSTNRATASAQIQIIVNPIEDVPFVANAIADFFFDEDTIDSSINLNNVFDDVDLAYGDALTYSFSGNTNIGVEISEGVVTLTPNANWNGSETITFTATDNAGESVSDEVVITVNPVNDAPVINLPESFTFDEDGSLSEDFSSYISDIDSENLTLSVSGNTNIQVAIDGENVTFSALENWNGNETLTFTVSDNRNRAIGTDDIQIIVNPVNDAPFVANAIADISFDEDTVNSSIDLNNVFDDADLAYGDALTYSFSGNTNIGVEISEGVVTLTPNANWNGSETITFTAIDTSNQSISDEVVITVNPVNDAPVINLPESFTFDEDGSLNEDFSAYISDIDSENLTLSVSGNTNIQVAIDGENVTFSALENWSGNETITFTVSDNRNRAIGTDDIQIIVNPVNDAPFLINGIADFSFDEDTVNSSIDLNNVFDDVDLAYGDALTYSFSGNTNIGVEISEGVVTLTPNANWNGSETITFTATDTSNQSISDEVVITVNPVNDAPVITSFTPEETSINLSEISSIDFEVIAEDVDSELSYTWSINTENQEITSNALTYEFNENGTYNINCIVSDGEFQVEQNWTVTLEIVNTDDGYLIPKITELVGNYPNPFNPTTTIEFNIKAGENASLTIFNIKGQIVKTYPIFNAGNHKIIWNGKDNNNNAIGSGIFFYRLKSGSVLQIHKMLLLK